MRKGFFLSPTVDALNSNHHAVRCKLAQPTGIDNPMTNLKFEIINHKFIKDGQLLIEHDGKTYNAQGAEVR